jgi:hypothetical protein
MTLAFSRFVDWNTELEGYDFVYNPTSTELRSIPEVVQSQRTQRDFQL